MANGTQYIVNSNIILSPNRLRFVRELVIALRYQRKPSQLVSDMLSLDTPMNLHDVDESKRILEQIMKSMQGLLTFNYSPDFYICALFINRADENVQEFNLEEIATKIKDWGRFEANAFHHWAKEFISRLNN